MRARMVRIAGIALVAAALLATPALSPHRVLAASYVVNSTADTGDLLLADGVCDAGGGVCTLRAAIQQANFNPGADTITFSIGSGVRTIAPMSALPDVTGAVTIDGTTQPGFSGAPIIELSGVSAGSGVDGLKLTGGSSIVKGLVINRWGANGIEMATLGGNTIAGNYIGTDVTGTMEQPNGGDGVLLGANASNNTIGGTTAGSRNVLSGNPGYGVSTFHTGSPASNNQILGNYIGTDASGATALPNASGVGIGDPNNTIGGPTPAARNVISGNTNQGVFISGPSATGTIVQGNYIGTDVSGTSDLGNAHNGIGLYGGTSANQIGGLAPGEGNLISGNDGLGIRYFAPAIGQTIQGNYVGTNAAGTAAIPNGYGMFVGGDATISPVGTDLIEQNLVSGNTIVGIDVQGPRTNVYGNLIGTQSDGVSPLGNAGPGMDAFGPTTNVGGSASGQGNTIAFNGGPGVYAGGAAVVSYNSIHHNTGVGIVVSGTTNSFSHNAAYANGGLGIDLGGDGVTPNDMGDGDSGANNLQNYPVITSATWSGTATNINVTFNSTASTTFTLEFFSNDTCDPSGYGEGQSYFYSNSPTTDAGGNASFTVTTGFDFRGKGITATATDPNGNTSEFSNCALVPAPAVDTDGDGCPDARELGADHKTGGQRNPNDFWDFFDVPTPPLVPSNTTGTRNHAISIGDAIGILAYIGTNNANPNQANSQGATYGSDWNNNGIADGQEYDRTPGAQAWAPGPPNGAVTIGDALIAVNGIGDNCN